MKFSELIPGTTQLKAGGAGLWSAICGGASPSAERETRLFGEFNFIVPPENYEEAVWLLSNTTP